MLPKEKSSLNVIRQKAERLAEETPLVLPDGNAEQQQSIIHELHVHQIELKIQNEELLASQQALQQTRNKYSELFNNAPVGYLILNNAGFVMETNQTFARMVDLQIDQIIQKPFSNFLTALATHLFNSQFRAFFKSPDNKKMNLQLEKIGGEGPHVAVYGSRQPQDAEDGNLQKADHDQIRIAVIDISEQREAEEAIRRSLAEKEVLLKEIHHRVKNNMQVISSLLDMQAEESQDDSTKSIFRDIIHRVRSMAMVHEKLYQSTDLAQIDFADYTRSLASYLWKAQGPTVLGITLKLDLTPVMMPVTKAVPCGLILSELFSNALKHGFNGRTKGLIMISLRQRPDSYIELSVSDDGVGIAADINWERPRSLGLRLVRMLTQQIRAQVQVINGNGTRFEIHFPR